MRLVVVLSVFWVVAVQMWGFIWRWESVFGSDAQFVALNAVGPLIIAIAVLGVRWAMKPR